jgi:hypothetical protein
MRPKLLAFKPTDVSNGVWGLYGRSVIVWRFRVIDYLPKHFLALNCMVRAYLANSEMRTTGVSLQLWLRFTILFQLSCPLASTVLFQGTLKRLWFSDRPQLGEKACK